MTVGTLGSGWASVERVVALGRVVQRVEKLMKVEGAAGQEEKEAVGNNTAADRWWEPNYFVGTSTLHPGMPCGESTWNHAYMHSRHRLLPTYEVVHFYAGLHSSIHVLVE